jgi:DNA-binding IclR family transcriptional regulator
MPGFGATDCLFVVSEEAVCARTGETAQMAIRDDRTSAIVERFTGSLLQTG